MCLVTLNRCLAVEKKKWNMENKEVQNERLTPPLEVFPAMLHDRCAFHAVYKGGEVFVISSSWKLYIIYPPATSSWRKAYIELALDEISKEVVRLHNQQ